jgi:outer membrane protein assembly factor BamB
VQCFDQRTGKLLWRFEYPALYEGVDYKAGPRATPTVHDGRVYTLGTMDHFFCFDAAGGKVLWKKDLAEEYKARIPGWGITSAPLIEGDLVIVSCGGTNGACLVAVDRRGGSEVWKSLDDPPGYSPPIAILDPAGRRQLVFWSARALVGLDPRDGKEHWRVPFRSTHDLSVMTPVHHRDLLFVSAFFNGAMLLKLDAEKARAAVKWRSERADEHQTKIIHCLMSTPQFEGDHFYGVDSYGELRCIEVESSKRLWETLEPTGQARWSNAHLTPNGDATFLWNERGELIVARLEPTGYTEIDRTRLLEPTVGSEGLRPVTWAHPAYAGKRIHVRNDKEILCAALAAETATE